MNDCGPLSYDGRFIESWYLVISTSCVFIMQNCIFVSTIQLPSAHSAQLFHALFQGNILFIFLHFIPTNFFPSRQRSLCALKTGYSGKVAYRVQSNRHSANTHSGLFSFSLPLWIQLAMQTVCAKIVEKKTERLTNKLLLISRFNGD